MNTEQIYSSVLGFIIGDVLGVPFEFEEREIRKENPVTTMVSGGTREQPIGTWSDDTSMVLCTIDSLSRGYNISDLGLQFYNWLYKRKFTPHGKVFDCGNQTRTSLKEIYKSVLNDQPITPLPPSSDENSNGNGSLMRILPLGFYLQNHSIEERWEIINEVSSLTHSHIRSIIGCFIYTELVIDLIGGLDKWDSYQRMKERVNGFLRDKVSSTERDVYRNILSFDITQLEESSIRSTPYVVYTLESVLWCFLRGSNYRESVLMGVNLGGDTDTIGSLVGGLSGIVSGMSEIPEEWLDSIVKRDEIIDRINKFVESLK
jgi:ADP-ribosylglycohydrolase